TGCAANARPSCLPLGGPGAKVSDGSRARATIRTSVELGRTAHAATASARQSATPVTRVPLARLSGNQELGRSCSELSLAFRPLRPSEPKPGSGAEHRE